MDDCARTPIMDAYVAPICAHATKAGLLADILGPQGRGLVPGGAGLRANEETGPRGHVHCSADFPNQWSDSAGFKKPGVNVYVQLDVAMMLGTVF